MNESDAEKAVLGNLLLKAGLTLHVVEELITAENFGSDQHAQLWSWIQQTRKANKTSDVAALLSSFDEHTLRARFGGADYIERLGDFACVDKQLSELAGRIADQARTRALKASLERALRQIGSRPVDELIADHEQHVMRLGSVAGKTSQVMHISEYAADARSRAKRMAEGEMAVEYIPTGFPSLDRQFIGWPLSAPTLIGGRPGMGKTALIMAAALRGASTNHGGEAYVQGIVSLEMKGSKLLYRLASTWSGVPSKKVFNGDANDEEKRAFDEAFELIGRMPIVMDDSARSLASVISSIQRMARIHGARVVYVDYFQLIRLGEGKTTDLDQVADALRHVCKAEDIALVILAQLNRECEQQTTRGRRGVPSPTHFRGTDKLLQDAQMAFAVYREFQYHPPKKPSGDFYSKNDLGALHQPVELIELKAREGGEGVELNVRLDNGRVYDLTDKDYSYTPWIGRAGYRPKVKKGQGPQSPMSYSQPAGSAKTEGLDPWAGQ